MAGTHFKGPITANGYKVITDTTWRDGWISSLSSSSTTPAVIALVGDSLTQGLFSSDVENTSWAAIVRNTLQNKYGDGGSGFKSSVDTSQSNNANFPAWIAGQASGALYTTTGTWIANTSINDGPGASILRCESSGATITYTGRGTAVDVYCLSGSGGTFGTFTISVDGGAESAVQNTSTGVNGVYTYTVTGLSPGTHTVRLTVPTAAPGNPKTFFCGMKFRNTNGVRVDRYGRQGWPSAAFNNSTAQAWRTEGGASNGTYAPAGKWSGGSANIANLTILSLGLNDANITAPTTVTPDTYFQNLRGYLEDFKEANPTGSVCIVMQHRGALAWENSSTYYSQYCERARALATAYKCGFINLWNEGNNSWEWMKAQGYMGTNGAGGGAGSDQVHLSNAGHAWAAQKILDVIDPVLR